MGLNFRKSFKIAPGIKMNIGKKGVGLSFGTKGARYSINSSGRRTKTIGIPGTGISYSTTSTKSKRKTTSSTTNSTNTYSRDNKLADQSPFLVFLVTFLTGYLGVHKFFRGEIGMGFLYLFTGGLFGIGWLIDSITAFIVWIKFRK